jgi:divalent metal cation (Fe/Co/Zn/Cd) transporter
MSQLPAQADAAQPKLDKSASAGIRASLAAVLVSLALGAVKIITGVAGHSYALIR